MFVDLYHSGILLFHKYVCPVAEIFFEEAENGNIKVGFVADDCGEGDASEARATMRYAKKEYKIAAKILAKMGIHAKTQVDG